PPTSRAGSASCPRTRSRSWHAPPRSWSVSSRVSAVEQGAPPFVHLPGSPELPPLLRRSARLAERQLDPGRGRDVADPDADRKRSGGRRDLGAAVSAAAPVRRLGRIARRSLPQ